MKVAIEAFVLGLFLMLFVGPSFFYLVKVGIEKGFSSAAFFALGIVVSDLLFVLIIVFGLGHLLNSLIFKQIFSIAASVVIFGIGIKLLFFNKVSITPKTIDKLKPAQFALKGFAINIINPFSFMIWFGVLGTISLKRDFSSNQLGIFIGVLLATILLADFAKALAANYIGSLINSKSMVLINKALGVIFIVLSFRLFYFFYTLMNYGNQTLEMNYF